MAEITMPQLGETVTEGTITKWFKSVGDEINEDEPLFEVSTDKVDSEVPSPESGYLAEILVEEGETVDVGTKLAVVSSEAPSGDGEAKAEKKEQKAEKAEKSDEQDKAEAAEGEEGREAAAGGEARGGARSAGGGSCGQGRRRRRGHCVLQHSSAHGRAHGEVQVHVRPCVDGHRGRLRERRQGAPGRSSRVQGPGGLHPHLPALHFAGHHRRHRGLPPRQRLGRRRGAHRPPARAPG